MVVARPAAPFVTLSSRFALPKAGAPANSSTQTNRSDAASRVSSATLRPPLWAPSEHSKTTTYIAPARVSRAGRRGMAIAAAWEQTIGDGGPLVKPLTAARVTHARLSHSRAECLYTTPPLLPQVSSLALAPVVKTNKERHARSATLAKSRLVALDSLTNALDRRAELRNDLHNLLAKNILPKEQTPLEPTSRWSDRFDLEPGAPIEGAQPPPPHSLLNTASAPALRSSSSIKKKAPPLISLEDTRFWMGDDYLKYTIKEQLGQIAAEGESSRATSRPVSRQRPEGHTPEGCTVWRRPLTAATRGERLVD